MTNSVQIKIGSAKIRNLHCDLDRIGMKWNFLGRKNESETESLCRNERESKRVCRNERENKRVFRNERARESVGMKGRSRESVGTKEREQESERDRGGEIGMPKK